MITTRKDYGPFQVTVRSIRAMLKSGQATLRCEVQRGHTPMGRTYLSGPKWFIKFDNEPCDSGAWTADAIRKHFTGTTTA